MRFALGVEYDGSAYCGWEVQREQPSIQACLEKAVSQVANHTVKTVCAGRTDSGVHANGQVVHFDSDADRTLRSWVLGCNANLPVDVSVTWAHRPGEDFHARFSAQVRHYRYIIFNRAQRPGLMHGRVTWEYRALDEARMREGAKHLLGEHDFTSYRSVACQAKNPVRTIHRLDVQRRGELVIIEVSANAFLHHMVRNIAGVLMAIGVAKAEPQWARQVLEHRDRAQGGVTARADGLYLAAVDYPKRFAIPRLLSVTGVC